MFQRPPRSSSQRGQVHAVRPRSVGVGEGRDELHASDEVHDQQHRRNDLRTSLQATQSQLTTRSRRILKNRFPQFFLFLAPKPNV